MRVQWFATAALALPMWAAPDMPKGIFRGKMLTYEGSPTAGTLIAKNTAGDAYGCRYDSKTYFEDQHRRTSPAKLQPGDPLEIMTDHLPGSRDCYVRIVWVVYPQPPPSRARQAVLVRDPPKGGETMSGMIIRVAA